MFKARPVMEGRHEVQKSLGLWHLSRKWVCVICRSLSPKCHSALEVKMGRGRQDELWVVGHFPSHSVVKMPDIQSASRLKIFSVSHLGGNPILNWLLNFPACFATVANRSAMCGRAGAGKPALGSWVLAASWNWARRARLWVGSGGPRLLPSGGS